MTTRGASVPRPFPDSADQWQIAQIDAVGNPTCMADATGVYTTVYDSLNRTIRASNADAKLVTYAFDAASRRTKMVDPDGGRFIYAYVAKGRLTTVTNPQANARKRTSFRTVSADLPATREAAKTLELLK
jgi:YD repeat-containing protein